MNRSLVVVPSLLVLLLGLSGCTNISDAGCVTDDQCRGDRVCSAIGVCESPERTEIDNDAGNPDTGTPDADTPDPGAEPIPIRSARVYDACDGDQHITRISLASERFPACDGVLPARVDINISTALDLNQLTPGSVSFEGGDPSGIQVLGCEGAFCVNADNGQVTLEFYEPGEIVSGNFDFQMQSDPEIDDSIAGQRFQGNFDDIDVNWCSFSGPECR